ncbi:alpha/beta hydrolase family protein [Dyadobacter psychrophilus]|uniref:Alpha/beta hydrolase family protein n=1 Tax=Dyadobacter psychrophilus TaxID=651661 RepID=A0A1T5FN39_9BACT|nr:lipase family protein [Dyadobacter psychrophilus]SKB97573.1 Alpha/beta hydrolase family protein [Dyadobacter psychrophilus]
MQKFTIVVFQRKLSFLLVWSLLLLYSCKDDKPEPIDPPVENQYLEESTVITELTKEQVAQKASDLNPILVGYVKNGIKVYKITYKTKNTDGTDITASGALILPATSSPASIISVQHGTIREDASAPSNFQDGAEAASFGSLFGSMGYIIAYPDYIGYGASKDLPHPYEHRASLASASLDMLRAAKEFLKGQTDVKWDEKLYIAGYSEGGYATMSLHKMIEEEAVGEFNLRASSCGAGAYDKTAFMEHVINTKTHGIASYNALYTWVLLTYDRIYNLNRPASYYFKEPFATNITANGISAPINQSFDSALNESFKTDLNDGKDKKFIDAIADNDVYNWKPKVPVQLYHGDKDDLVFYFNSVKAYDTMKALGANVTLTTIPGGTHGSSVSHFLIGTLAFFTSTK